MNHPPSTPEASDWVRRWLPLLPQSGEALDLACGHGRHTALLLAHGLHVTALDRDADALAAVRSRAQESGHGAALHAVQADVENAPWPWLGRLFDAVVVTNYLWRPLLPTVVASLKPGGVLIYETFAIGNEAFGRPRNPVFLLKPGELLEWAEVGRLQVVAYEHGRLSAPDRVVQRMVAINACAPYDLKP